MGMIVQFPDIGVHIDDIFESKRYDVVKSLGLPEGPDNAVAHYIGWVMPILADCDGKLAGATIDEYIHTVRFMASELAGLELEKRTVGPGLLVHAENAIKAGENCYLETMVNLFARNKWIYGVVVEAVNANGLEVEQVVKDMDEINEFLRGGNGYNPEKLARTLFVPSPIYTGFMWGFDYKEEYLRNIKLYLYGMAEKLMSGADIN